MKFSTLGKKTTLAIAIAFQASLVSAQSIWTNPITGSNPGQSNPYTTGDVADPNIIVSGIGRGSGVNGSNGITLVLGIHQLWTLWGILLSP